MLPTVDIGKRSRRGRKGVNGTFFASPEDARDFEYKSSKNEDIVRKRLSFREGCKCDPYKDVFTPQRWMAQGFIPGKFEPSIPLVIKVPVPGSGDPRMEELDPNGDHRAWRRVPANVYCRCQVDPLGRYDSSKSFSLSSVRAAEEDAYKAATEGSSDDAPF